PAARRAAARRVRQQTQVRSLPVAIRAHRRPGRHGLLVCALISSGCAASSISWRGPSPHTRVEVFYATDRKALSSNSFAGDRGSGALSFGISPVLLPARTIALGIPLSQEKFEQSLSSALTRTGARTSWYSCTGTISASTKRSSGQGS